MEQHDPIDELMQKHRTDMKAHQRSIIGHAAEMHKASICFRRIIEQMYTILNQSRAAITEKWALFRK